MLFLLNLPHLIWRQLEPPLAFQGQRCWLWYSFLKVKKHKSILFHIREIVCNTMYETTRNIWKEYIYKIWTFGPLTRNVYLTYSIFDKTKFYTICQKNSISSCIGGVFLLILWIIEIGLHNEWQFLTEKYKITVQNHRKVHQNKLQKCLSNSNVRQQQSVIKSHHLCKAVTSDDITSCP